MGMIYFFPEIAYVHISNTCIYIYIYIIYIKYDLYHNHVITYIIEEYTVIERSQGNDYVF